MNKELTSKILELSNHIHNISKTQRGNYMITNPIVSESLSEYFVRIEKLEKRKETIEKILNKK